MNVRNARTVALTTLAVVALGVTACNRTSTETADGEAGAASESPIDAVPSDARVAASTDGMAASSPAPRRAAPAKVDSETLAASGSATTSALNSAPGVAPTSQETIAATKATLSPAGASSGPTAPAPK